MTIKSEWNYIEPNRKSMKLVPDNDNIELLFDDGSIRNINDDNFPFAIIIAWREVSQ